MSFSTQTTLPAFITPGWNDPPSNLGSSPAAGGAAKSSILSQRNRRPVDPSIAGATATAASPMGYAPGANGAPHQAVGFGTSGTPPLAPSGGQNSTAFTVPPSGYPQAAHQWAPATPQSAAMAPHSASASSTEPHRAVYDAFSIRSNGGGQNGAHPQFTTHVPYPPVPAPATTSAWTAPAPQTAATQPPNFAGASTPPIVSSQPPLETSPASIIYAPPNCVAGEQRRPPTQPDPATWTPPVKAAGDVSLTGPQLVAFLTKATMRLPQVKCEGVQLRLSQLNEVVAAGKISDACLKKLNFVVDAIDREQYEEAWSFFEQMNASFSQEMGGWAQGVKILISELRRPAERVGSAGSVRVGAVQHF